MAPEYIHHIKYVLCIIEYHSWALCKVDENEFNLIEKYVCADYGPHSWFLTSEVNRLRFLLFKSSDTKLRKFYVRLTLPVGYGV